MSAHSPCGFQSTVTSDAPFPLYGGTSVAPPGRAACVAARAVAYAVDILPSLKGGDSHGRPWEFSASQAVACPRRGARRSYTISTDGHRQPGGQNVHRGVDIAVVLGPA